MSSSQYQGQLDRKRKSRIAAETKAGELRSKESKHRADAASARLAAEKTTNATTRRSKLSKAEREDKHAQAAGKDAAAAQSKASGYLREESALGIKVARALKTENEAAERKRKREQQQAERKAASDRTAMETRLSQTESVVRSALRDLPEPKPEKLRVLMLAASSEGDLRVGREQKRIRAAVESALHRDHIEFDVRTAATGADLLDGITKFRPHVVHFSGHSDDQLIVFEDEQDEAHPGVVVSARTFAKAIQATDTPPLLVLLNSCNSAAQIDDLVAEVVPFAIGMADSIDDVDAINYAAQFYAAITNGQSIDSSHLSAQVALELLGLDGAELPTLAWADDVDPTTTVLVTGTGI